MKAHMITLASALAFTAPAWAEDATKVDPATSGPTEKMTDKVPEMKTPPANTTEQQGPTKNVGDTVPPMKPKDENANTKTDASGTNASGETSKDKTSKE